MTFIFLYLDCTLFIHVIYFSAYHLSYYYIVMELILLMRLCVLSLGKSEKNPHVFLQLKIRAACSFYPSFGR